MADGTKGSGIEGESVVVAEIPLKDVVPAELEDFVKKVPGAEVVPVGAKPGKPATVELRRNFIRVTDSTKK